jgi:signal transduction histidine kinase
MPIMINKLVENSLRDIADHLESSKIQLKTELSPVVTNTLCNHSLVKTVVMSLVTNAIDSMPEGGKLTVKTGYLADEDRIELTIDDTSSGINEKDLPHLFDPYFILKIRPSTKLTGLELALAQLTVQSLGGSIVADSKVGEGTTFSVKLPVYKGAVSAGLAV